MRVTITYSCLSQGGKLENLSERDDIDPCDLGETEKHGIRTRVGSAQRIGLGVQIKTETYNSEWQLNECCNR